MLYRVDSSLPLIDGCPRLRTAQNWQRLFLFCFFGGPQDRAQQAAQTSTTTTPSAKCSPALTRSPKVALWNGPGRSDFALPGRFQHRHGAVIDIAEQIVAAEADYVLAVKENQRQLYDNGGFEGVPHGEMGVRCTKLAEILRLRTVFGWRRRRARWMGRWVCV